MFAPKAVGTFSYPQTNLQRLAWYAKHMSNMRHTTLVRLACNPKREVIDKNERLVAIILILRDGIQNNEEAGQLLKLLKDENDYPLNTGDRNSKENNAILRGNAAIALARYGLKTRESIDTVVEILNSIEKDPVFIKGKKATNFYLYFLTALYLADKTTAKPFMIKHSISESEIENQLRTSLYKP